MDGKQKRSSSSWGCELKYWRMLQQTLCISSSSSWGCELKYLPFSLLTWMKYVILFVRMWVEIFRFLLHLDTLCCHPLREDVSWNIMFRQMKGKYSLSSSSWGCELKYWLSISTYSPYLRHPLREDVSWNVRGEKGEQCRLVILFVRMWVEMR